MTDSIGGAVGDVDDIDNVRVVGSIVPFVRAGFVPPARLALWIVADDAGLATGQNM